MLRDLLGSVSLGSQRPSQVFDLSQAILSFGANPDLIWIEGKADNFVSSAEHRPVNTDNLFVLLKEISTHF